MQKPVFYRSPYRNLKYSHKLVLDQKIFQYCYETYLQTIQNELPTMPLRFLHEHPKCLACTDTENLRYCAINPTLMVSQMPLKYSAYHPHFLRDTLYFFHPACIQSSNLPMVRSGKYNNYSCYPPDVP